MSEVLILNVFGEEKNVTLKVGKYYYGDNMSVNLICTGESEGEPYGSLTVNFSDPMPPYYGYLDVNNFPDATEFVERNGLGKYMGIEITSGFATYPLYKFDPERLRELCPDDVLVYERSVSKEKESKKMPATKKKDVPEL